MHDSLCRDVMKEEIIIAEMVISLPFEVKVLNLKLVFQVTGILNYNLLEYSKRNTIFEDSPPNIAKQNTKKKI